MDAAQGLARRLVVAAAQPKTVRGDLAGNAMRHADVVASAGARLVVFPELSLNGYHLADEPTSTADPRLTPLVEACSTAGATALVGALLDDGGRRIGVLEISAAGVETAYVKMSLGGPEPQHVRAGTSPGHVDVDGWRVGIGICKDTRMAAHLDATAALPVDLYVAGLVHTVPEHHELELRARRIATAYTVPVVLASHAGPAGHGFERTAGGSGIWDARGRVLARAGADPGTVVTAELVAPQVQ